MQTHVERDPREGVYKVWAWVRRGGESLPLEYRPLPGGGMGLAYDEAKATTIGMGASLSDTPPTFVIDADVVEALVEAYDPGLHPGNALSAHLSDAIKTRDRLLTLIERAADKVSQ